MKTFGEAGLGIFPAPEVIAEDILRSFSSTQIGSLIDVTETYIAISPQRNLRHPSVLRIANSAKAVFSL
jgi:LysR family transcriptional activator of nhaA